MKARLPQGYGKQNMNDLMRQAQEMQQRIEEEQARLEETEYKVTGAGGMVELTMLGNHQVVSVKIKPEAVDPEDIEMLEDMVAATVNEAVRVVNQSADDVMNQVSSGYNIPGVTDK